jgi:hypothetical protein
MACSSILRAIFIFQMINSFSSIIYFKIKNMKKIKIIYSGGLGLMIFLGSMIASATSNTGSIYREEISFTLKKARVSYILHKSSNPTATELEMYLLIEAAMDKACNYYSNSTSLTKQLDVYYNSEVPTADGNRNGTIRFGARSSMNYITAMHEIAHTIGVGTSGTWSALLENGVYIGVHANAVYRSVSGDSTATIQGDRSHFWPYGLNYTTEVKSNDDLMIHCRIVEAMLKDGL